MGILESHSRETRLIRLEPFGPLHLLDLDLILLKLAAQIRQFWSLVVTLLQGHGSRLTFSFPVDLLESIEIGQLARPFTLDTIAFEPSARDSHSRHTLASSARPAVSSSTDDNRESILVDQRACALLLRSGGEQHRLEMVKSRHARV